MSQAIFTFCTVSSPSGACERFIHSIEKRESRKISKFQALGFLEGWVDAHAQDKSDFGRMIGAVFEFDAEVAALGFEEFDPVHILTAGTWEGRMLAAWCLIGGAERAIARGLDYSEVHNYWPDDDFCTLAWDKHAQQWASRPKSHATAHDFTICSVVGNPKRPQIEYRQ